MKENLPKNIRIQIDGGKLSKTADGKITMGNNPTILTWIGIAVCGMLTLGIVVAIGMEILRGTFSNMLGAFFAAGLLGYLTFLTFQQSQRGQIIIDPTSRKIQSRKREINFDEIESLVVNERPLTPRGDAIIATFVALINNGAPMVLGTISGNLAKTEKKKAQVIELLSETGLSLKTSNPH